MTTNPDPTTNGRLRSVREHLEAADTFLTYAAPRSLTPEAMHSYAAVASAHIAAARLKAALREIPDTPPPRTPGDQIARARASKGKRT